jgi:integrase
MKHLTLLTQRKSGQRRMLAIVNPLRLDEAFQAIRDSGESLEIRTFLALALSGGCRISEALALRPCDLDLPAQTFQVKVLKKRKSFTSRHTGRELRCEAVIRTAGLHPIAAALLTEYLATRGARHFEPIFRVSSSTIDRALVRLMGEHACPHSLRHSHITYQAHVLGRSELAVMDSMEISRSALPTYFHAEKVRAAQGIWRKSE